MKVGDFMSHNVRACRPEASLADAARMMKGTPCGFLPVRNGEGRLVGVVTDRDICMTVARIERPAREIPVREAMTPEPVTCSKDEDVLDAVRTMQQRRVHRLPVMSREGDLEGVLSINDVVDRAGHAWEQPLSGISFEDVVPALQAIHERIVPRPAGVGKQNEVRPQRRPWGAASVRDASEH